MNPWTTPVDSMHISDNHVHVWITQLSSLKPHIEYHFALLDSEEQQRSERFIQDIHRERFIAAHGFMRITLSSYLLDSPADLCFEKTDNGKPAIIQTSAINNINFNLSHSNDIAILAIIRNQNIGIDIEHINKRHEWKQITRRYFTAAEQDALFSLPENRQRQAFYQVWTRKEAHMKVTAKGLKLSPSEFTVSVPPARAKLVHYSQASTGQHWKMQDIELGQAMTEYCACLSVEGDFNKVENFIFSI